MQPNRLETAKTPETHEEVVNRINLEVAKYFESEPLKPKIILYNSWDELSDAWVALGDYKEDEAPDWLVGCATTSSDEVHILSPDIMPRLKSIEGPDRFKKTLKHELVHVYLTHINNKHISSWLNEGIALHVAGQDWYDKISLSKVTIEFLDKLYDAPTDGRIYNVGKNMVDMIVEVFGKEKIIELVKISDKNDFDHELKNLLTFI